MFEYKDIFNIKLLEFVKLTKPFDLPIINAVNNIPKNVLPFNYAKTCQSPEQYYIHFYIDDYQFERIWKKPKVYMQILSKFKGVIGPDFSTYTNMPIAQQIYQVYKSRLLTAYWQSLDFNIIPNVSWSDERSLDWSLDGLPKHSTIALSTNGVLNKKTKQQFIQCYKKAIKILEPTKIIIVGEVPKEIKDDKIIQFNNRINILRNLKKEV